MKCHQCGTEAQHGDKFCLKCGSALKEHVQTHEDTNRHLNITENAASHPNKTESHVEEEKNNSLICHNCGREFQEGDKFCLKCGNALATIANHESAAIHHTAKTQNDKLFEDLSATLPAEQAEKILKDARKMVKHLSKEELIMGGASVVALLSFFLPWYPSSAELRNGFASAIYNGWYYLLPLLSIASIVLLYFSQGAKHSTKLFITTVQAVVGMFILAMGLGNDGLSGQIGLILMTIAGGVLLGTSLYFQKKVLIK